MLKGLRSAIYATTDLAAARAWYARAFGIAPYFDEPFYVGFNVGGFELGLVPVDRAPAGPGGVTAMWGVDDVEGICRHLTALGATVHEEPHDVGGGIVVGAVLDPFGNILGLIRNPHFDPAAVK